MKKPRKPRVPKLSAEDATYIINQVKAAIPAENPVTLKEVIESSETICEKARRLAREAMDTQEAARLAKKQAFLDSMFKPGDYTLNEDGTYTICGWKWRVMGLSCSNEPLYLTLNPWYPGGMGQLPDNLYRDSVLESRSAYDLAHFGRSLLSIDENIANIEARYQASWWTKVKNWFIS